MLKSVSLNLKGHGALNKKKYPAAIEEIISYPLTLVSFHCTVPLSNLSHKLSSMTTVIKPFSLFSRGVGGGGGGEGHTVLLGRKGSDGKSAIFRQVSFSIFSQTT
jgi:hypothetical protein